MAADAGDSVQTVQRGVACAVEAAVKLIWL